MKDSFELRNLTDHYIQIDILSKLAQNESAVRFTDLKDPGIENSLFMYHANKLLNRGLIQKQEPTGFALTQAGARWINFIGVGKLAPQQSPRLLVQFVVTNESGEVLLSCRTGSMGNLLNEYMLPGGLYKYGRSADENDRAQLASFISSDEDVSLELITIAETIQSNEAAEAYHSISYIYQVRFSGVPASDDPQYELEWFKQSELTVSNNQLDQSRFIPEFFTRFKNGLQSNELFLLK